jgi:hypothetical protein
MADPLGSRLKHAWNAFRARDETGDEYVYRELGYVSTQSPVRPRVSRGNERSMIAAVYNRIAMDVASIDLQHVRVDQNGRYLETLNDGLNQCLTVEANKDQTGRALIQDIVLSMFDEGAVAVVPVDTTMSPVFSGFYDINSLRVGKILEWYPSYVRVELYNDRTGMRERLLLPKSVVAIIENPLYAVMNEPNSTIKRLVRKLNILDAIDEQSGSGKLDLIIQLPYTIRTEARQKQADDRRRAIEQQLSGSKYGIAYTDGTEHITQLNRPSENNLMGQITYLTTMMYSQLGITEAVFNGTADEKTMLNYYSRTVDPLVKVIIEEMRRKFLTKTARTQGQTIAGYRDIFKLVPASEIAKMADSFKRNEIVSSNDMRSAIGLRPSSDPKADELRNSNMPDNGITQDPVKKEE